jgi:hypothetical protein
LIHKLDPELKDDPKIQEAASRVQEEFGKLGNFQFIETSIHDYLTIVSAFSQGLKATSKLEDILNNLLRQFARATFSSAVFLLEDNYIIIEQHASNEENMQNAHEGLRKILDQLKTKTYTRLKAEVKDGIAYLRNFSSKEQEFYILCYSKNASTEKLILEKLPELATRTYDVTAGFV